MCKEKWKPIKGFEGVYKISSHGRLKSFKSALRGRILSNINKNGDYISVVLGVKDKIRYCRIHVLVAEAFISENHEGLEVNHIDGNKQNNHIDNLEWVTRKENIRQAISLNPNILKGMIHYNKYVRPKKIRQLTLSGELINKFNNAKEAQKITGVCQRNILQVAARTEWKPGKIRSQAGGYKWMFEGDRI